LPSPAWGLRCSSRDSFFTRAIVPSASHPVQVAHRLPNLTVSHCAEARMLACAGDELIHSLRPPCRRDIRRAFLRS
jgi:hypothetical protein